MVFSLEGSRQREQELVKLLSKEANPTIQEKKSLQKQLDSLRESIANNLAFQSLQVGDYVAKRDSSNLGKITEKKLLSQPTIFVSWGKATPVSEQPSLLQLDEIANSGIVKAGDIVRVANKENGQVTGYRLEKVVELHAHGYIEIANNEVVSSAHGHWQLVEEFDRWDFDWIIRNSCKEENWINIKASLARADLSTAKLALEWIKQYRCETGEPYRIEALEKRIRWLTERQTSSLPPLEYLQELSIKVSPPIAAKKVDAAAVERLLNIAVAAVTAKELDVAEYLIADAQKFAKSRGLVLNVNMDGWLIAPLCKTAEEALALCPVPGSRVCKAEENNTRFGTLEEYATEVKSASVQVQALVKWDDGTAGKENGFTIEAVPPLLEYLSQIENAEMANSDEGFAPIQVSPVIEEIKPPLPLGVQEVLVSELRSHPINSRIYGEVEDDTTLDEMIQSSGWIKTLLVTPERDVVGGNRRLRIARKQGRETVLVEVREFASDEAVLEALLLDNAVREKSTEQKVREARFWLPIESEKAKLRKGRIENQENFPGGETGQVRDIVAARVGLGSGKSLQKAEKVLAAIEALKEVDAIASEGLRDLLNNKSIHAAYRLVCESEERLKWQPKVGDRVTVSLKAERHAGVSGTISRIEKSACAVSFDPPSEGMSEDLIHLNLLLPADIAAYKAKQQADREAAKPETRFGLQQQTGGGLLPEKIRNEGFDPDADATPTNGSSSEGDGKQNVVASNAPSNVINLPSRVTETTESTSVAMEIAMGIRHLTPKELAEALNWAAEDNTKPLTDDHLDALMAVITNIWARRHPEVAN